MRDYIDIGASPANERCAQVGEEGYAQQARAECNRFIELIRKTLGEEPGSAHLTIKSNPHGFGTYFSTVCYYDDTDEEAARYAARCEDEAPTRWGKTAPPAPAVLEMEGEGVFLGKPVYSGKSTVVKEATCNFCQEPAIVDGRTTMGAWGDMCGEHYKVYGVGIGVGYGQRFINKPEPAPSNGQRPTRYCDSCRDAAEEEGAPDDDESIGMILAELGGDIADHDCDDYETGGCLCVCRRRFRNG